MECKKEISTKRITAKSVAGMAMVSGAYGDSKIIGEIAREA